MFSIKKDIFESARIKLTLFYVLIIAVVSLFFSTIAYNQIVKEVNRGFRMQRIRLEMEDDDRELLPPPRKQELINITDEVRRQVKQNAVNNLIIINTGIIFTSFAASYFLAGKTLSPIQKAMSDQKNFIANASHDLKTPISVIKLENEVLLNSKFGLKKAKHQIESNLEEINRLSSLVESIISQNVISDNTLNITTVNVYRLAKNSTKIFSKKAEAKGVKFEIVGNKIAKITGDKNLLSQVFNILLDNAVKFSNNKSTVKIVVSENMFSVTNSGKEIRKDDLKNIFDRFYTSDKSRNKNINNGFGLGLSIAKDIIDKHKGKISVESKTGKTTFTVEI